MQLRRKFCRLTNPGIRNFVLYTTPPDNQRVTLKEKIKVSIFDWGKRDFPVEHENLCLRGISYKGMRDKLGRERPDVGSILQA